MKIFESLSNLQPNKTSGIDRIGPHILKSCATALTAPLHYLFTKATVPSDWKIQYLNLETKQIM